MRGDPDEFRCALFRSRQLQRQQQQAWLQQAFAGWDWASFARKARENRAAHRSKQRRGRLAALALAVWYGRVAQVRRRRRLGVVFAARHLDRTTGAVLAAWLRLVQLQRKCAKAIGRFVTSTLATCVAAWASALRQRKGSLVRISQGMQKIERRASLRGFSGWHALVITRRKLCRLSETVARLRDSRDAIKVQQNFAAWRALAVLMRQLRGDSCETSRTLRLLLQQSYLPVFAAWRKQVRLDRRLNSSCLDESCASADVFTDPPPDAMSKRLMGQRLVEQWHLVTRRLMQDGVGTSTEQNAAGDEVCTFYFAWREVHEIASTRRLRECQVRTKKAARQQSAAVRTWRRRLCLIQKLRWIHHAIYTQSGLCSLRLAFADWRYTARLHATETAASGLCYRRRNRETFKTLCRWAVAKVARRRAKRVAAVVLRKRRALWLLSAFGAFVWAALPCPAEARKVAKHVQHCQQRLCSKVFWYWSVFTGEMLHLGQMYGNIELRARAQTLQSCLALWAQFALITQPKLPLREEPLGELIGSRAPYQSRAPYHRKLPVPTTPQKPRLAPAPRPAAATRQAHTVREEEAKIQRGAFAEAKEDHGSNESLAQHASCAMIEPELVRYFPHGSVALCALRRYHRDRVIRLSSYAIHDMERKQKAVLQSWSAQVFGANVLSRRLAKHAVGKRRSLLLRSVLLWGSASYVETFRRRVILRSVEKLLRRQLADVIGAWHGQITREKCLVICLQGFVKKSKSRVLTSWRWVIDFKAWRQTAIMFCLRRHDHVLANAILVAWEEEKGDRSVVSRSSRVEFPRAIVSFLSLSLVSNRLLFWQIRHINGKTRRVKLYFAMGWWHQFTQEMRFERMARTCDAKARPVFLSALVRRYHHMDTLTGVVRPRSLAYFCVCAIHLKCLIAKTFGVWVQWSAAINQVSSRLARLEVVVKRRRLRNAVAAAARNWNTLCTSVRVRTCGSESPLMCQKWEILAWFVRTYSDNLQRDCFLRWTEYVDRQRRIWRQNGKKARILMGLALEGFKRARLVATLSLKERQRANGIARRCLRSAAGTMLHVWWDLAGSKRRLRYVYRKVVWRLSSIRRGTYFMLWRAYSNTRRNPTVEKLSEVHKARTSHVQLMVSQHVMFLAFEIWAGRSKSQLRLRKAGLGLFLACAAKVCFRAFRQWVARANIIKHQRRGLRRSEARLKSCLIGNNFKAWATLAKYLSRSRIDSVHQQLSAACLLSSRSRRVMAICIDAWHMFIVKVVFQRQRWEASTFRIRRGLYKHLAGLWFRIARTRQHGQVTTARSLARKSFVRLHSFVDTAVLQRLRAAEAAHCKQKKLCAHSFELWARKAKLFSYIADLASLSCKVLVNTASRPKFVTVTNLCPVRFLRAFYLRERRSFCRWRTFFVTRSGARHSYRMLVWKLRRCRMRTSFSAWRLDGWNQADLRYFHSMGLSGQPDTPSGRMPSMQFSQRSPAGVALHKAPNVTQLSRRPLPACGEPRSRETPPGLSSSRSDQDGTDRSLSGASH